MASADEALKKAKADLQLSHCWQMHPASSLVFVAHELVELRQIITHHFNH